MYFPTNNELLSRSPPQRFNPPTGSGPQSYDLVHVTPDNLSLDAPTDSISRGTTFTEVLEFLVVGLLTIPGRLSGPGDVSFEFYLLYL